MRHITPILAFKNTQRFFSRFALWSMLTCILLLLIGCKGCDNELEDNVGNGNDNPEVLFIETWGTEIRNALQVAAGYDCLGTADFEARVNIEVRTAHLEDGVPVIDPIPYYEEVLLNVDFFKNNGFNEGTIIDIEVPETGGYLLAYEVEINQCSECCHGIDDRQCGSDYNDGICEAGYPKVGFETVYHEDNRPPPNRNLVISHDEFVMRQCICGCDVEC